MSDSAVEEEAKERQQAELEFVHAAYEPEEAWVYEGRQSIGRRLKLEPQSGSGDTSINIVLTLDMPALYPMEQALEVSATVEKSSSGSSSSELTKAAYKGLPTLVEACSNLAKELQGEESVLTVFQQADDWVENDWPAICSSTMASPNSSSGGNDEESTATNTAKPLQAVIEFHHMLIGNSHKKEASALNAAASHGIGGFIFMGGPSSAIVESACLEDLQAWLVDCKKAGKEGQCVYWQFKSSESGANSNNKLKTMPYATSKDTKMDTTAYRAKLKEVGIPFPFPDCPPLEG